MRAFPPPQGLYDGCHEHDACGVAFVATLTGVASHDIVAKAITALRNLEHRGATGAEPDSGDGAGILLQVPDRFLRDVVVAVEFGRDTSVTSDGYTIEVDAPAAGSGTDWAENNNTAANTRR